MSGRPTREWAGGAAVHSNIVLSPQTFVCVSNVVPGLPASRAGLQAGDRIMKVRAPG